jgi:hypothetical protein
MIKNLIFFFIIANLEVSLSLEAGKFIYDVENNFDKDNNEFTFENNSDESAFYLIIIKTKSLLYYRYECSTNPGKNMVNSGSFALSLNLKKESCNFVIKSYEGSEVKGSIMVHPLNIEIKADFNKKEKYLIDGVILADEKSSPIIYTISNLEEDISVKFSYAKVTTKFDDKSFTLSNPFKVCLKDDCKEKVETYKFLKGNNYKIYLVFEELKTDLSTRYEMPPFSFEKI